MLWGDKELETGVLGVSISSPIAWEVYTDGVANQKGFGVRIVLVSPKKLVLEKSLQLAINNETEYKALLVGMTMVVKLGGKVVEV